MALFAIGDMHLSFSFDKPMDIFGDEWIDHSLKIKEDWMQKVGEEDTVLITGDTSWALRLDHAKIDLDWISELPGNKVIIKGNHDYWWQTVGKLNGLYPNMFFMQNNYFRYEEYGVCGTRGWTCPNDTYFVKHDEKIYTRELARLEMSLKFAKAEGVQKFIVMLHYPPTNDKKEPSGFTEILEKYNVEKVIYGHLHGAQYHPLGLQGKYHGIEYYLVSCDYTDFKLIQIK